MEGPAPVKHLLYSEVEEALRASVRDLLGDHCPPAVLLDRIESGEGYHAKLWSALAAGLGVAGLAVDERDGGQGASWRETSVVAEELGRSLAPTPFLGSAVLGTELALRLGDRQLLGTLAVGGSTAALVIGFDTVPGKWPTGVAWASGRLSGAVRSVADVAGADHLFIPATGPDGEPALFRLDTADNGASITPVVSLDLTRPVADVTVDVNLDARSGQACLVASGPAAITAVEAALTAGAAMLAAEQLGLAERCLEVTLAYLKSRYQFGRKIGSYQALKHRVADQWALLSQARAAVRYAAACLADGDPDTPVAASVAKGYCSVAAVRIAEECIQMHGGIGFTWEHPAHLYLKRAKADALALGSPRAHYARLAGLVGLTVS
jgi:alkylation response protein AidB-like acyl-CoA dehydrogenase